MNSKYSILYIDNEESNPGVFKNTFRMEYNIYLASSAMEGIEILSQSKIDVIITDQRMLCKTGLELLKEIHEMFPHLLPHRLMISDYAAPYDIDTAFREYGFFRFISKPWETDELRQIITNVIELPHE